MIKEVELLALRTFKFGNGYKKRATVNVLCHIMRSKFNVAAAFGIS